jgi:tripartite-type tricarboxylate transporter receptor subunit TctC
MNDTSRELAHFSERPRRRAVLAAIASVFAMPTVPALAEAYPAKAVKIVVPYAPGGAVDMFARLIAKELSTLNGQPYIVDNKGGAGGAIAASEVAKSAPDGYTLLLGATGPNAIVPAVYGAATSFDPVKDFAPVTLLASMPYVLVVNNELPVHSVADLIAYAKARDGRLNYGSSGTGGPDHLAGELFKQLAHVNVLHVPYKGSGPALADLAAGHVQYLFTSPLVAMPLVEAGRVRVIGMTGRRRSAALPNVPAIAEVLPAFELSSWYGFFAPAATPGAVVSRINSDVHRIYKSQAVRDMLAARGVQIQASTPEEFSEYVKSELARWSRVVHDAGIKAQ